MKYAAIAVKRIGYGWKKSKNSQVVYALINPKTQALLEGKEGVHVYPYNRRGLSRARAAVSVLNG